MVMPEINTERLLLRALRSDDLDDVAAMNADPRVMEHFPAVQSRQDSEALLGRIRSSYRENGFGVFAVLHRGAFLGFAGLTKPRFEASFTPCVEIGWRFTVSAWGKGFALEAAEASLRWGFEGLGLEEIVSFTAFTNTPSERLMQRLGMQRDLGGDFDHPMIPAGDRLSRHCLYRLTAEAWRVRSSDRSPVNPQ